MDRVDVLPMASLNSVIHILRPFRNRASVSLTSQKRKSLLEMLQVKLAIEPRVAFTGEGVALKSV